MSTAISYCTLTKKLGGIELNLRVIEYFVRKYLWAYHGKTTSEYDPSKQKARDTVDADDFTNYKYLEKIIKEFNATVINPDPKCKLDKPCIITLRDMFAHGRLFGGNPFFLVKFSSEDKTLVPNKVTVEFNEELSEKWLCEQIEFTVNEVDKIKKQWADYNSKNSDKLGPLPKQIDIHTGPNSAACP